LHDEVGQVLTAIKVELAVAQRTIASRGDSVNVLEDAQAIADGAIHTVRDLSHLLHPAMLDDLGLPAAIDSYLRGFRRRHGIQAELLHGQMDERLAPQIEAAGYRIVQEALTNVAKHAKAMRSRVYLQRLARTVLITIEDDGTGFDVSETESGGARKGLGLISMRERVSQLQGTMRIESAPGKGTRVTVELPALARRVAYEAAEVIHG
jgi:signal transduction histidine kinase